MRTFVNSTEEMLWSRPASRPVSLGDVHYVFERCRMASLTLGQRLLSVQTPSSQRTHPSLSNLSSGPTLETFKASCAKLHARGQGTEIELSSVNKNLTPHWPEKKKTKKLVWSLFNFRSPGFQISKRTRTFRQLSALRGSCETFMDGH